MKVRPRRLLPLGLIATLVLGACDLGWGDVIQSLGVTPGVGEAPDLGFSTPNTGFGIPTQAPPARMGVEVVVGSVAITVTNVTRHADDVIARANQYPLPESDREFVIVDVSVRCVSTSEACHVTEFDFAITTPEGGDYAAEFASAYSNVRGLFEGGEIQPGGSLSGSLVFRVRRTETGLLLTYPRLLPLPGYQATFRIET